MGVYPTLYDKKKFKLFLIKNNVNDVIIDKFDSLPEKIKHNKKNYDLYINLIWYSVGDTFYNFELNYYCDDCMEFLFNSKVFMDVGISVDNMLLELKKIKILV